MLMQDIKVFLGKRQRKIENIFTNDLRLFLKKRLFKNRKNYSKTWKSKDWLMFFLDKFITLFFRDFCFR